MNWPVGLETGCIDREMQMQERRGEFMCNGGRLYASAVHCSAVQCMHTRLDRLIELEWQASEWVSE